MRSRDASTYVCAMSQRLTKSGFQKEKKGEKDKGEGLKGDSMSPSFSKEKVGVVHEWLAKRSPL